MKFFAQKYEVKVEQQNKGRRKIRAFAFVSSLYNEDVRMEYNQHTENRI